MTSPQPLPTWLTRATATHRTSATSATDAVAAEPHDHHAHPASEPANVPPAAGQVRRLDPMDAHASASRLVLIIDTDQPSAAAQVVLLSNETEMGSDNDALLPAAKTGLAYDLLALFDITAPAWYVQLGPVLTTVTDLHEHPVSPAGTPVNGPEDSRWSWKQAEHDALVSLTGECTRQVIDEGVDSFVDPAALDVSTVTDEEFAAVIRLSAPLLQAGRLCVPVTGLRRLHAAPVRSQSTYWESIRCLLELLPRHEGLLVDETAEGMLFHARGDVRDDTLANALRAVLDRQPDSSRSLRLFTLKSLWDPESFAPTPLINMPSMHAHEPTTQVWELLVSGRRHQLVVHAVDEFTSNQSEQEERHSVHV
jgi:hypothetical protein